MKIVFPTPAATSKSKVFPSYAYAQRGMDTNLERVVAYTRKNRQRIKSDFILTKLLTNLPSYAGLTTERYYDNIELVVDDLARSVNISTSGNAGKTHTNQFYGKDSVELLVSTPLATLTFDDLGNLNDWESIESIRILYHPSADLNLDIPNGETNHQMEGICSIAIDIAALAAQYLQWVKTQEVFPREDRESLQEFIYSYPLTNALRSQLNISLFNRLLNVYNSVSSNESTRRPLVPIVNYTREVDKGFKELLEYLERDKSDIDEMLDVVQLSSNTSLRSILPNLEIYHSRQVYWNILASYEPFLDFIVNINLVNNFRSNRTITNKLRKEIKRVFSDKSLQVCPHIGLREYLMYQYESFENLL